MSFFSKLKEVFVKSTPDTSEPKKLDQTDIAKLVKNSLFVGCAAIVTYFSQNLTSVDFGQFLETHVHILNASQWNLLLIPIISGALDAINKYFKGIPEGDK